MKKTIQTILIITLLPLCLIGCGPKTKVTSSWVNEQQVPKIGTILIIAISEKKTSRRLWEDSFVEQFAAKNINAVASHTIEELSSHTLLIVKRLLSGILAVFTMCLALFTMACTDIITRLTVPYTLRQRRFLVQLSG